MANCGSDTKVLGAVVVSILGASRSENLQPLFEKYNISECEPDQFYPTEPFIEMIDEIVRTRQGLDSMYDFVSLGVANGLSVPLPPEIDTLEKWITIFEDRYPTLYRGSNIGYVRCEKETEGHYRLHICWPWVDDIAYGMVFGMCKRFLPPDHEFSVYYETPPIRADFGDDETVIHVTW
jgi:hypothetical protein